MALGKLPLDQLLAGLRICGAGFLGLDAKQHPVAGQGQQTQHQQGMEEVEVVGEGFGHGVRGGQGMAAASAQQSRTYGAKLQLTAPQQGR